MTVFQTRRIAGALVIALSLAAQPALSQQANVIEEIVVVAQKREQNLQDVPIAVTAYTGDMLQEANIKDIRDLATIVPTLTSSQSQNSTTSSFAIRGVGTSSQNFGLESSVGIYIDGVYRARQSSIINNLVDVASVEVLRGPQGTLFGKNTPSGALLVNTVRPTAGEPNAFLEVNAGDLGLLNLSGATNITLGDNLALRATGFYGQRDGFVDDINFGSDVLNDRDRFGGRLQLAYTSDNFDMRIIADYAEIDEVCCATLTLVNNFVGFGSVLGSDSLIAAPAAGGGLGLPVITADRFEDYVVTLNTLPRSTNEDAGLSAEFNFDFENMTLTSITAFRTFDSTDFIDADFGAAEIVSDQNIAEQSSFSQEFRLAGQFGRSDNPGNWLVGAYFFMQDIDNFSTLTIGDDANTVLTADPVVAQAIAAIDGLSAATGGAYPPTGEPFPGGAFAIDNMRQQHESYAVFGQFDFPLGENFLLTAGLRWTNEQKDMDGEFLNSVLGPPPDLGVSPPGAILQTLGGIAIWQADPNAPGALDPTDPNNAPIILGALGPTYVPGWGLYTQPSLAPQPNLSESIDDDQVSGTIKMSWFVSDTAMLYASYGTGYKSGGTNTDRINPVFSQVFDAETSTAIEIGMKAEFAGNTRLNVALHNTQVEDLQTSAFSGNGFNLQNAGDADTYGAEVELFWQATDTFNVQASYAYNVADFENFENGTCWVATPFQTGTPDPGQGDPSLPVCDRSGDRIPSNPENSLFAAATKDFRLGNSTTMYIRGEVSYLSDTMTDGNNDPLKLRDSFTFVNARIGFLFENIDSELAIWGRNLTDERFYETVFDVPIQDGKLNAYPHEPLTWGVQFRKDFN